MTYDTKTEYKTKTKSWGGVYHVYGSPKNIQFAGVEVSMVNPNTLLTTQHRFARWLPLTRPLNAEYCLLVNVYNTQMGYVRLSGTHYM